MATDAAFLDEVSDFLNTIDIPLIHTPLELVPNISVQVDTSDVTSISQRNSSSPHSENESRTSVKDNMNNKVQTTSLNQKRKKEVLRKQRYQKRLKNEREALRQTNIELSVQLEKLKRIRQPQKNTEESSQDSPWRSFAIQQRQQRLLAEMEQKQLQTAIHVQASYIGTLRRALPDHVTDAATCSLEENMLLHCVL